MAHCNFKVFLGFEDEYILEKHSGIVNYTTNKIGGLPNWPHTDIKTPPCPLCALPRLLVLQIYAPLENSQFHRTLYLFACINPNCWNQNESWACLRSQILEQSSETANISNSSLNPTEWCHDADDWDDNNANFGEENGNLISPVAPNANSDEEEDSCSFEDVRSGFGQLTVDERNANTEAAVPADLQGGGAVGRQNSPTATAEIEVDESEIVTIDTPTAPQHDLTSILQEVAPLPQDLCQKAHSDELLQFLPSFISVSEENSSTNTSSGISDHHIRDLLQEYQLNNEDADYFMHLEPPVAGAAHDPAVVEKYEKSIPAHGDKIFHHFLTRIQMNPGQILRYGRGGATPLLLSPLQDVPRQCKYCQGELMFEFQVLSTLIPKLRLHQKEEATGSRLEFGTVLIFSCARSCWPADTHIREEFVIVQCEK